MSTFSELLSNEEIKSRLRIIFVAVATMKQADAFIDTLSEWPCFESIRLILDSQKHLHRLFGLYRGVYSSLILGTYYGLVNYGFSGVLEGIRLGFELGGKKYVSDSWQQGGMVLLGPSNTIHFVHREKYPGDWIDLESVLKTVQPQIVMGPINYSNGLESFIQRRLRQRKNESIKLCYIMVFLLALTLAWFWIMPTS